MEKRPVKRQYHFLFTEAGTKVKNIMDVPEGTRYLVASTRNEFKDVEFREPVRDTNREN